MKQITFNDMQNQMVANNMGPGDGTRISYAAFKREAKKLQIWWRENELGVGYYKYENVLQLKDAKKGLIFFEDFREEIMNYLKRPIEPTSSAPSGQMLTNLLRSEHIPYNIFFPMRNDLEGCALIFNNIIGKDTIKQVTDIKIEYHPEQIQEYLNDHTAFDVFINYINHDDEPCGIGVEVKYTEKEYPLKKGSREEKSVNNREGLYQRVTAESGWFREGAYDLLITNKFRQIWRNHILGASMIMHGDIKQFYSVTLFPELNVHFMLDAMTKYKGTLLSEEGFPTCIPLTYENLFKLMDKYITLSNKSKWIKYLRDRYIFTQLDCLR